MLDSNDIKQIGTLIKGNNKELTKDIVGQVVVGVGEFIDQNVLPAIGELIDEKLEEKLEQKLEEKLETKLADKLRPLPDRDFIVRQIAAVKGESVALLRKEDEKVDLHIKFSHENKVLTDDQRAHLRALHVFPSIEV